MISLPGLVEIEASGLLQEIIEDPPAGVPEPGGLDIADHLPDAPGGHPGQGHAVAAGDIANEAIADGQVDLGVGRGQRVHRAIERLAEDHAVLVAEGAVAVAVARLPIVLGGMTRGDEKVGTAFVQLGDDGGGGILRPGDFAGNSAEGLLPGLTGLELRKPIPLLDAFHRERRAGADGADDQGSARVGDLQGLGGVETRDHAPLEILVGVGIVLAGQPMHHDGGLGPEFLGTGHPGDEAGLTSTQFLLQFHGGSAEDQHVGGMRRLEAGDDLGPALIVTGRRGDEHDGVGSLPEGGEGETGEGEQEAHAQGFSKMSRCCQGRSGLLTTKRKPAASNSFRAWASDILWCGLIGTFGSSARYSSR